MKKKTNLNLVDLFGQIDSALQLKFKTFSQGETIFSATNLRRDKRNKEEKVRVENKFAAVCRELWRSWIGDSKGTDFKEQFDYLSTK